MHAGLVEGLFVMRDVLVGVRQRPRHAPGLQRGDFVAGCPLGLVQLGTVAAGFGLQVCRSHRRFPYFNLVSAPEAGIHSPPIVREWPRNSAIAVSSTVTRTS